MRARLHDTDKFWIFHYFSHSKIGQIFWYYIISCMDWFSDHGFGISVVKNPYFEYLLVPNGSGLVDLELAQKQGNLVVLWWLCGVALKLHLILKVIMYSDSA